MFTVAQDETTKKKTNNKKEFNQIQTEKRTHYRQKAKTTKLESHNQDGDTTMADTTVLSERDDGPRSKKARVDSNGADEDEGDVDAETEEERDVQDDDNDDNEDEGEDEQEGEEEAEQDTEENGGSHVRETQDVLEDGDEALGGDESD